jgi:hypothetical protein
MVALAGRRVLAAEILQGRRVSIRVEASTLMFFDPETRELCCAPDRTRSRPWKSAGSTPPGRRAAAQALDRPCHGRPPGELDRRDHHLPSEAGLGRAYAGRTITVHVSHDVLAVELDDETLTIRRTTNQSRPPARATVRLMSFASA